MSNKIPKETLVGLYETMLRIRMFEEKVVELYPAQEMKTPVHLYIGQEAIAAGVCLNLVKDDYLLSNHRGHGHCIAKGTDMGVMMAEFYGKAGGCSGGKGGSMHLVDPENSIPGNSAIVGGGIPMAVGAALASQIKGLKSVAVTFFGDGAVDEGVFHESMSFASLKKLPVVFVCENNLYATNSHITARHPTGDIAGSAGAYGVPGVCVDGNDPEAVYECSKEAVERARKGTGPSLIEARTYRWKGHVGPDADFEKGCRPEEELREWMEKCPVKRFRERLLTSGVMSAEEMDGLRSAVAEEVDKAVSFSDKSPWPDTAELTRGLYYEGGGK
ncbi:MAG: thiamine pyrophosphate-dependent dehydrogenase E1 component subunit alpha [Thermodesulfobacteriota bacterium]